MANARKNVRVYEHPSTVPRAPVSESEEEDDGADSDAVSTRSAAVQPALHRTLSIPRHPVSRPVDRLRQERARHRQVKDRRVCVSCGEEAHPDEKFVKLRCGPEGDHVIHVSCIRCPCKECGVIPVPDESGPNTKNPSIPASAYSLWPFTQQPTVTPEDVRRFVERNGALLVKPTYDHPSGTATARAVSSFAVL